MLWYAQGDAAAKVGAEVVVGGGAPKAGRREEDGAEGHEGEKEMTLRSYLQSKGHGSGMKIKEQQVWKQSCRLDYRRSIKQGGIMDSFFMTDDITPVYNNQRR